MPSAVGIGHEIATHDWKLLRKVSDEDVTSTHLVHDSADEAQAAAKFQDGLAYE